LRRPSKRGVTVDAQQAFCSCLLNWGTRHVAV
jgi:hypothetical protein